MHIHTLYTCARTGPHTFASSYTQADTRLISGTCATPDSSMRAPAAPWGVFELAIHTLPLTTHMCHIHTKPSKNTHAATHRISSDVRPWKTPAGTLVI